MYKKHCLTSVLLFCFCCGFAQEKTNSISIDNKYPVRPEYSIVFDHDFLNTYYPLSCEHTVNQQMKNIFFGKMNDISEYKTFTSSSNAFYHYHSNGFHFWENSSPLALGFSIHLNEIFGWNKLDIFMDAQGELIQTYNSDSDVFVPTNKQAFNWNSSVGAAYKISNNSTLFIKRSLYFQNSTKIGKQNIGGVNMKF